LIKHKLYTGCCSLNLYIKLSDREHEETVELSLGTKFNVLRDLKICIFQKAHDIFRKLYVHCMISMSKTA